MLGGFDMKKERIIVIVIALLAILLIIIGFCLLPILNNSTLPEQTPTPTSTPEESASGQDYKEDPQTILDSFGLMATKGVSVNLRLTEVNTTGTYRILALIYNHDETEVNYGGIGFDVIDNAGNYVASCTKRDNILLKKDEYQIIECDFNAKQELSVENVHYHIINTSS